LGSVKSGEFLDHLSDCKLLNRYRLGNKIVDRRIILKWFLMKWDVKVLWTTFIELMTEPSGGLL
jgi:hypothetical protein